MSDAAPENYTLALGGLQIQWQRPAAEATVRIHLEGDLDNMSLPVLRQALDSVYAAGCFSVVLDLAGLEFIDSSGLGAMVGAWRRCGEAGGTLSVHSASAPVQRLMDMTGISKILAPPR